ncbi:hypothetical protein DITRI_Ditri13aG0081700 [Diplodiscus trichospermus]
MGQFCIDLNVDMMGLLLALVIAIALMLTCVYQPPRRAMVVPHRIGCKQKPELTISQMGKIICSELNEGNGLDLTRLLIALVIALTLMAICIRPPPRRAMVLARRIGFLGRFPVDDPWEEGLYYLNSLVFAY